MKGKVLCDSWLSQAMRRAGGFGACLDLHRVCTQAPAFADESLRDTGERWPGSRSHVYGC